MIAARCEELEAWAKRVATVAVAEGMIYDGMTLQDFLCASDRMKALFKQRADEVGGGEELSRRLEAVYVTALDEALERKDGPVGRA